MSLPASGGTAFTTATCVKAWIEYPFNDRGDVTTKVYHHTMRVSRANYAPLAFDDVMTTADEKPTRSPFSDDAAAYWVGDTTPTAVQGDLVEFDRLFANVPSSRVEPYGYYPISVPGRAGIAGTDVTSVSGETVTLDALNNEVDFVFTVSSGDISKFSLGMKLWVKNDANANDQFRYWDGGPSWIYTTAKDAYVTNISGNTVTAVESVSSSVQIYQSFEAITTFSIPQSGGAPIIAYTKNSPSKLEFSYEKIDSIDDLILADKFQIFDANGSPVDTLSATTDPTESSYDDMVSQGTYVNAEAETFKRWRGNIYEKIKIRSRVY